MICRWRELRVACVCMSLASVLVSYLASIASVFQAAFVSLGCFVVGTWNSPVAQPRPRQGNVGMGWG